MATKSKTEKELWLALEGLDDDLLDPGLPELTVDAELRAMGVDPDALGKRGLAFVAKVREEQRLSWQDRAREVRARLEARAARATLPANLSREGIMARLEQLRVADPKMGPAIKMAARKRKPEESSVEELRALLAEMEALRSIEDDE